jgi:hypothetical protein
LKPQIKKITFYTCCIFTTFTLTASSQPKIHSSSSAVCIRRQENTHQSKGITTPTSYSFPSSLPQYLEKTSKKPSPESIAPQVQLKYFQKLKAQHHTWVRVMLSLQEEHITEQSSKFVSEAREKIDEIKAASRELLAHSPKE